MAGPVGARPCALVGMVAVLALAGSAQALAQAPGTTPQEAIAGLNAQRAAHGIPADLVENPEFSLGCRLHMAYEQVNGRSPANPHSEDPAKPGYTDLGGVAAQSSVLGDSWDTWATGNPWEDGPIHLMDTLAPALTQTGWAPGCMWTARTVPRPAPATPQVFTYPGPGAVIYPQEMASESPFVPGDFVGLPMGTVTGPHLFLMPFGQVPYLEPGDSFGPTRIVTASLTGPAGPVEVRTVDEATTGPRGNLGQYLDGAMIIPVAPLRPGSRYMATATLLYKGFDPLDVAWAFRTSGEPDAAEPLQPAKPATPRLRIARVVRSGSRVRVTLLGAEAAGRRARIATQRLARVCSSALGPARTGRCGVGPVGRSSVRRVTLRSRQTITLARTRYGHRLVVTTPRFRARGIPFDNARLIRVVR